MQAISLFSCGGIGDLALRERGVEVLVANELSPERAQVFKHNFPETLMITGDIWEERDEIINATRSLLHGRPLDWVFATPPCQGMSKNGRGKLLSRIRKGERPEADPRNLLVIPAVDIFLALGAETLIMENVPEMANTLIPAGAGGKLVSILEYIKNRLGTDFTHSVKVVEFADYGVPQRRQRLISVFSKNDNVADYIYQHGTIFPPTTHARNSPHKKPWVTLRDAISHLPPLDAKSAKSARHPSLPFHRVPVLDDSKYLWVSNTPTGKSAFDNQCVNQRCGFDGNPGHGNKHDEQGINRASADTPIRCGQCGDLLPRPWVEVNGQHRLMRGYTSAYKRMDYDLPASALTRNVSYACSDNKLHPQQHRVLSLHEAMILHTLADYPFEFKRTDGKKVSDKLIRELIGESIPPAGLSMLFAHFLGVIRGDVVVESAKHGQLALM